MGNKKYFTIKIVVLFVFIICCSPNKEELIATQKAEEFSLNPNSTGIFKFSPEGFHNDKKMWPKSLPFVSGEWGFRPVLMMTLGKANKYFHERLSPDGTLKNDPKYNTNPLFETIFEFWDKE